MSKKLEGKVAAITGAASGIGLACAKAMLGEGATVVIIDRDEQKLTELEKELGESCKTIVMDLLDKKQVSGILDSILEVAGGLDIFHANAGMYIGGAAAEGDPDQWDKLIDLNVNSAFRAVNAILPHMIKQQGGDIIFTSSISGITPVVWEPLYVASKYAVEGFIYTTRRQVNKDGVRISSVLPGPVHTALLDDWPKEKLDDALATGSIMPPEEVAEAVLFMVTRQPNVVVRDLTILPNRVDL